jgi:hypothetical protein
MAALKYWDGSAWRTLGNPIGVMNADVSFGGYKATNLGTPTAAGDAATKNYVDTRVPLVTVLPANPVDGQEVYFLADATNGVIWRLRYRAYQADGTTPNPSTFKWEVVGGAPLLSATDTTIRQLPAGTTTYTALTGALSITVPLAGDYDVTIMGDMNLQTAGAIAAILSYFVGGVTAPATVDGFSCSVAWSVNTVSGVKTTRQTGVPAAAVIAERARLNAAGSIGNYSNRRLIVQPVRVA